jgi:hypothetical protein
MNKRAFLRSIYNKPKPEELELKWIKQFSACDFYLKDSFQRTHEIYNAFKSVRIENIANMELIKKDIIELIPLLSKLKCWKRTMSLILDGKSNPQAETKFLINQLLNSNDETNDNNKYRINYCRHKIAMMIFISLGILGPFDNRVFKLKYMEESYIRSCTKNNFNYFNRLCSVIPEFNGLITSSRSNIKLFKDNEFKLQKFNQIIFPIYRIWIAQKRERKDEYILRLPKCLDENLNAIVDFGIKNNNVKERPRTGQDIPKKYQLFTKAYTLEKNDNIILSLKSYSDTIATENQQKSIYSNPITGNNKKEEEQEEEEEEEQLLRPKKKRKITHDSPKANHDSRDTPRFANHEKDIYLPSTEEYNNYIIFTCDVCKSEPWFVFVGDKDGQKAYCKKCYKNHK